MHLDKFWGLNESYLKTDLVVVFSKYLILLDPWLSKFELICIHNASVSDPDPYHWAGSTSGNVDPGSQKKSYTNQPKL